MLIRNLMATTALTALVATTGAYAQTTQSAGQQKQERPAEQPQKEVTVSDRASVIIHADDQMTDVRLRIQTAAGEKGAPNARVDNSTAARQQGAAQRPAQQGAGAEQPTRSQPEATHVVAPGGTIIVRDQDKFQLNFQVRQSTKDQTMGATPAAPAEQSQRRPITGTGAPAEPGAQTKATADEGQRQVIAADQVRASDLTGSTVYGANDENVGSVGDVLLTGEGGFDAVIVDVGGFLGIGTREVALGLDDVEFRRDRQNKLRIHTPYTRAQIEAAPAYEPDTYRKQRDRQRIGTPRN